MNRSTLVVLLATATAAFGAQAHTYTDNARIGSRAPVRGLASGHSIERRLPKWS